MARPGVVLPSALRALKGPAKRQAVKAYRLLQKHMKESARTPKADKLHRMLAKGGGSRTYSRSPAPRTARQVQIQNKTIAQAARRAGIKVNKNTRFGGPYKPPSPHGSAEARRVMRETPYRKPGR